MRNLLLAAIILGAGFGGTVDSGKIANDHLSGFGDLVTVEPTLLTGWLFHYGLIGEQVETATTGSGATSNGNGLGKVDTTAATSSSATISTHLTASYTPGYGQMWRATAIFSAGVAGSEQRIGLGDGTNGWYFGYNGADFGVMRYDNGAMNFVDQSDWNIDKLDGTGPSGMIIDPTKGNVYACRIQWLGFGAVTFYVENGATGALTPVHRIDYTNANTAVSVRNPTLPFEMHAENTTNNTSITVQSASAAVFREGGEIREEYFIPRVLTNAKATITTETNLLTVRNKTTFNAVNNHVVGKPMRLSVAVEGAKSVTIRLTLDTTLGGSPSYADVDTNDSPMEYDTAGTTLTGGTVQGIWVIGKTASQTIDLTPYLIHLDPGQTITVSAESANSTDVDIAILWHEIF